MRCNRDEERKEIFLNVSIFNKFTRIHFHIRITFGTYFVPSSNYECCGAKRKSHKEDTTEKKQRAHTTSYNNIRRRVRGKNQGNTRTIFVVFLQKCYKLYSTIQADSVFYGIIMYMCDLLYACIWNTSCSACQITKRTERKQSRLVCVFFSSFYSLATILNLRLYAVKQPFRWQCIAYYDEENTHNIQNTKYMKIVFIIFFLLHRSQYGWFLL